MTTALTKPEARRVARLLATRLGPTDHLRLINLIGQATPQGSLTEATALQTLFPNTDTPLARAMLRRLARRVETACAALTAEGVEASIAIVIPRAHVPPHERIIRFEGRPRTPTALEQHSGNAAMEARTEAATPPPARIVGTRALEDPDEPRLVGFVHDGATASTSLVAAIRAHLTPPSTATRPDVEIRDLMELTWGLSALDIATRVKPDFVVWILTPTLLANLPMRPSDLPKRAAFAVDVTMAEPEFVRSLGFVDVFPHALKRYDQLFKPEDRNRYASEIARFISDRWPAMVPPGTAEAAALVEPVARDLDRWASDVEPNLEHGGIGGVVDAPALKTDLYTGLDTVQPARSGHHREVDALSTLVEWALEEEAPEDPDATFRPYCALLGDSGSGKTTMAAMLTHELLARRRAWSGLGLEPRMPIYLDLRDVGSEYAGSNLDAEGVIDRILQLHRASAPTITAASVLEAVRSGNAVLIVDGLDEVIVHLNKDEGQRFARMWWTALGSDAEQGTLLRRPKLLMACRTHYFRKVVDQATFFRSQHRDRIRRENYLALELLPFDSEQIRRYFELNPPEAGVDRALATIASLHNLSELATRPMNLAMIASQIDHLIVAADAGNPVSGAALYGGVVAEWLERDEGKHNLTAGHKLLLMEHLAALMARRGSASWTVDDVEDWLVEHIAETPLRYHYEGVSREILKEDLRTATFLVRTREDEFRFAHTSLREFFTAKYLVRGLEGDDPGSAWAMPRPSDETLDFLGALVSEASESARARLTEGLRRIGESYRSQASELALAYALHAERAGYPRQSLVGADLRGSSLAGWEFAGNDHKLDLRKVRLDGADLRDSRFLSCRLDGASFHRADLARARVLGTSCEGARFDTASMKGTVFRKASLLDCTWTGSSFHETQVIWCPSFPRDIEGFQGFVAPADHDGLGDQRMASTPYGPLSVLHGHSGAVRAVVVSPDGTALATASIDNTVRLWDPVTGQNVAVFTGHTGQVHSVAFGQVDGKTVLASGSDDHTVRLWDPTTGNQIGDPLQGHTDWVNSVAFGQVDGKTVLASSSDDHTVRLWDPTTGHPISNPLQGHTDWVHSVTFGQVDGKTVLASSSSDGTVRLWDPTTGHPISNPLQGHTGRVFSVTFGQVDGKTVLASSSSDRTVRLWDPTTGHPISNPLQGHTNWVNSVAFGQVDGKTVLASSSNDDTVRLWDPTTDHPIGNPL
ncbi:MAG: pentapeptide repeat-containing protein, partial [Micrococcales bacterium]|nr:pentapeptide repeat-containing protein [Micrococcales bacterium]